METRTNWHSKALDLGQMTRYNQHIVGLAGGRKHEII